ncbi:MAG TPA: ABC transporter permease subunit [Methylomirabilota bacterium]|nr:ABC transporter permease subunit [Methylomirabilota bacterium]
MSVIAWFWMLNPPLITSYSLFIGNLKHAVDGVLGGGAYAFLSVALFNVWRGGSFTAVFLLAGLNAVPTELFDYARLETRSAWQRLYAVTLPLLRPYLALAVFLSFTTAVADLANVWMLTGGRIVFPVLGTQAYWLGIRNGQLAEAAARSLSVVPVLVVALAVLFHWFDGRREAAA